ncbi:hypothetical protein [Capnocytophaga sputigena]|uniref:Uncharacterized protein n=1 Tax=Capnocytophaga sputigena TaxID=1019 RepID=A0AAX2IAU0_CAPSP|nr:hypothetical protein [Capnocytophaga sputigena]ATA84671.1 hypothetical protein CGC55_09200 [Capnocytophaga sputigena]SQA75547.1 Uncharacterised protein [Capnocytophaga sputigena]
MNQLTKKVSKKGQKKEELFGEKLLKIGRIILIVLLCFSLLELLFLARNFTLSKELIDEIIIPILSLTVLIGLYGFFYRWVMDKRMRYSQYTRGELPSTIRVKALKDKTFQWIKFLSIVVFYTIVFWISIQMIKESNEGVAKYFYLLIGIAVLIVIIVLFGKDLIKNTHNTFYALEIKNGTLFIFYKEELTQTIDLKSIHHIHFFLQKVRKGDESDRIHPRMQIYTSKTNKVLHIKLSIDNYLLLKAYFSHNHLNVTDEYNLFI